MRRIIPLLLALVLTTFHTYGQELSGTWKVAYIRSMEEVISIDSSEDSVETIESFSTGTGIVEFSGKTVKFHNFKEKPNKARIKKKGIFKLKGEKVKIESFNKDSVILRHNEDKQTYIILKPFISEELKLNPSDFSDNEWQIESEYSTLSSLKLHFSDSSTLTLNYQGEKYGYANYGEWRLVNSGNYYGLYIVDREALSEYFFYLRSKSNEILTAEVSLQEWSSFPEELIVSLVDTGLPSKEYLKKRENLLVGNWSFSRFINSVDTLIFESILSVNFSIQFKKNGHYISNNSVKFIRDKQENDFNNTEEGTWELAKNGSYLIIKSDSGWEEYLSIQNLNEVSLTLDLNYRYDDRARFSTRIEFKKGSP
ncbi:hypothetical protein [Marivirga arenosa]|uniref:Lipocalin-like domain-containing protein n=1 Tax=Marivirga arenosa TaxID=3059076 RepID=A0AA49GES1_9BACT|nr:hypothetical protein [Marivirga sp. BKB1-2]WKK80939.2 hypothetical protein QYS47_00545 [Marivirga sp. BKB1-2]